jgi:hypothetical protein
MGQLINKEEIVENNIQDYLNKSLSEYTEYFEGTPTFVTYYATDDLNTTEDESLHTVVEVVGEESPVKFNKIENFVLYGVTEMALGIEEDGFGYVSDYNGSGVILPDTVRPRPDDYFVFEHENQQYLFKVTSVNVDKVSGDRFYEIDYAISEDEVGLIDEQIYEEYSFDVNNIGDKSQTIVKSTEKYLMDFEKDIISELFDHYKLYFFNEDFNCFIVNHDGKVIYDRFLTIFIRENNLLQEDYIFTGHIFVEDYTQKNIESVKMYQKTIYKAIENHNTSNLLYERFFTSIISDQSMPFYFSNREYHEVFMTENPDGSYKIFNDTLTNNIKNNIEYTEDDRELENIIIKYFNNQLPMVDTSILETINTLNYSDSIQEFYLIPLIIYILKEDIKLRTQR